MRRYELMLLLRPDLEDDKLQSAVEKVTRAIVNGGGSLSKVSPWGKRRLAYDIGRHREASYNTSDGQGKCLGEDQNPHVTRRCPEGHPDSDFLG
jgi:ribosomal protein S6